MNIALIPARAGSKRLPGKNVKNLGGRALVEWQFDLALRSSCFGAVVCSTDDEDVKRLARRHRVAVDDRLPEHAGDHATTEQAVLAALKEMHGDATVVLLQPTSPFTAVGDVLRTIEAAKNSPVGAWTTANGEGPSGNVYAMTLRNLRRGRRLAHPRCSRVRVPAARAVDIDTEADWMRAEAILRDRG